MADSTDTLRNQHAFYDTQYDAIMAMFGDEDDPPPDGPALSRRIEEALSDPFLPRWHRADYHILVALYSRTPEDHVEKARISIEDMTRVLQHEGQSPEQIDARLRTLPGMLDFVVSTLEKEKQKEKEKASKEQYV
jgi:hypothetical protein